MSAILPPPPNDEESKREALGCTYLVGMVLATLVLLATLVSWAVHR